ncbi:MAG: ATP-binding cassette domain-containing protein [Chloroflexota bacterium]|nr:ATP-binding cassette domain-containing protein [Chloroflexota bacterium]
MTATAGSQQPLLDVQHVRKYFPVNQGVLFRRPVGYIKAVDDVAFTIAPGETFGLVGESGCGKSTLAKLILLLEPLTEGEIVFEGQPLTRLSGESLRKYRGTVGAVFQDPFSSLSPRMRVRDIVGDPLTVTTDTPRRQIEERVAEVLDQVGLNPATASNYPHEFSGGQRQRIAIARALSAFPRLVILDEPVSALDASIRAQIINLLKALQQDLGLSYLLIAHDLGTVRFLSDHVGVMYLGQLVERSTSRRVFTNPLHPYTRALLSAALPVRPDVAREEVVISGEVPSPLDPPSGCRFFPRCPAAMPVCETVQPLLAPAEDGHEVACHLYPTSVPRGATVPGIQGGT